MNISDKQLLKDMSSNIWVTGATFQSRAKVYNLNFSEKDKEHLTQLQEFARTFDGDWKLNEQRVNDAWFIWVIVNYHNNIRKLSTTKIKSDYSQNGKG